jgi:hypothetical protein
MRFLVGLLIVARLKCEFIFGTRRFTNGCASMYSLLGGEPIIRGMLAVGPWLEWTMGKKAPYLIDQFEALKNVRVPAFRNFEVCS